MAVTQFTRPFLQDVTKDYARLGAVTSSVRHSFAPTVAGQDPYQTTAYGRVPGGIGAYEPYITGKQAGAYSGRCSLISLINLFHVTVSTRCY